MIKNKVCIIGAGMVGAATMIAILNTGLVAEIVMIDQNEERAEGEAIDAFHTTSFTYMPNVLIRKGSYEDCKDAQIIVMTAGPSIKPGDNMDRRVLTKINAEVTRSVMSQITVHTKEAIIIFVSNPVDIVTYIAQNEFHYPRNKIIGSGTLLDTARMRRIIGEHFLIDTKNVHGYILGEHGRTSMATWSSCNIGGIPIAECSEKFEKPAINQEEVLKEVVDAGIQIIMKKGYTNFGIAETVARLIKAITLHELSVLPISTTLEGEYGIQNVALSVPCIIGQHGIERILQVPLNEAELESLKQSAESLKETMREAGVL
ncbi:L-lactate dehydrogenase [Cellulosilyticum ruminicola]|uniref:L-lactate dehydrogenase n=1 Tax=Cellulosilyticum ruminicola TaxID=425254 RepID=UPI0006D1C076|nr:L-lactate dehydrogenase [Cellulosilyticum ruminicola]